MTPGHLLSPAASARPGSGTAVPPGAVHARSCPSREAPSARPGQPLWPRSSLLAGHDLTACLLWRVGGRSAQPSGLQAQDTAAPGSAWGRPSVLREHTQGSAQLPEGMQEVGKEPPDFRLEAELWWRPRRHAQGVRSSTLGACGFGPNPGSRSAARALGGGSAGCGPLRICCGTGLSQPAWNAPPGDF